MDANRKIREENLEDTMVMSMDVDALFPSMTLEDVLETIMELFLGTELAVRVEDDKMLAQYLMIMLSKEEIEERGLSRQMPRRTVEEVERTVRKVMVALMMRAQVKMVFTSHL